MALKTYIHSEESKNNFVMYSTYRICVEVPTSGCVFYFFKWGTWQNEEKIIMPFDSNFENWEKLSKIWRGRFHFQENLDRITFVLRGCYTWKFSRGESIHSERSITREDFWHSSKQLINVYCRASVSRIITYRRGQRTTCRRLEIIRTTPIKNFSGQILKIN